MGLFGMFGGKGMDAYVDQARKEGATLVDVRAPGEYAGGHVEGAINIPLPQIPTAQNALGGKDAKLFVYCLSGARSGRACSTLKKMGYTDVTNIGGINLYHGPVVKGV